MDLLTGAGPRPRSGPGRTAIAARLLMGSTALGAGTLLGAGESLPQRRPFDVPDDYQRLNGVLRYHQGTVGDYWTLTAMAYSGQWNSTDQVPAARNRRGVIDRFGSLGPTDGGEIEPLESVLQPVVRTDSDQVQFSAYLIRYKLDLWSTFTYYLRIRSTATRCCSTTTASYTASRAPRHGSCPLGATP